MPTSTFYLVMLFAQHFAQVTFAGTGQSVTAFQLTTPSSLGPVRLGPSWTDRSRVACASTCMTLYAACTSFMFNPATKLCTPGSDLSSSVPPTAGEGDLYVMTLTKQKTCDTSKGFSFQSYGNEDSCIGYFSTEISFGSASWECGQKGAVLAKVATTDKLKILQAIAGTLDLDFWVGCSDKMVTHNYVWEDGTPLSSFLISQIFGPGESTKSNLPGNCCQYCPDVQMVLVNDCSANAPYACEM